MARALAIAGRGEPAVVQEVIVPEPEPGEARVRVALLGAVATGELRAPIAQTFRLDEAPDALGAFASPKLGKLVVTVP